MLLGARGRGPAAVKTLNPPGTATPMRPRPFLLLLACLTLMAALSAVATVRGLLSEFRLGT